MKVASLFVILLPLFFSCNKEEKKTEKPNSLPPIDNIRVELGQAFFKTECGNCHKMEFKSIGPDISDLVHQKGENLTQEKLNRLRKNKNCYTKELSITDARDVLEYLRQYELWLHEINGIK